MTHSNNITAEPSIRREFGNLAEAVDPSLPRYELSGRLSNAGTYINSIRIPNLFDSEHAVRPGKLYYGEGTDHWSDIYWRCATDIAGTFRYFVFSEIRRDLQFKLFDLLSYATSRVHNETFFKGTAFIIKPSTIPHSSLAQLVAKEHRRKTVPVNDGSYFFEGSLTEQL